MDLISNADFELQCLFFFSISYSLYFKVRVVRIGFEDEQLHVFFLLCICIFQLCFSTKMLKLQMSQMSYFISLNVFFLGLERFCPAYVDFSGINS